MTPTSLRKPLAALALLATSATAHARGMTAVPEGTGYCADKPGICHEWILRADPGLRFIAMGHEAGIDYGFHRKRTNGEYRYLVRVHPVLQDSSKNKTLFWGYPWDIEDIAVGANGAILATFNHVLVDDGEVSSPSWQKRIPAVLFTGRTTQAHMTVAKVPFRAIALPDLQEQAASK